MTEDFLFVDSPVVVDLFVFPKDVWMTLYALSYLLVFCIVEGDCCFGKYGKQWF